MDLNKNNTENVILFDVSVNVGLNVINTCLTYLYFTEFMDFFFRIEMTLDQFN